MVVSEILRDHHDRDGRGSHGDRAVCDASHHQKRKRRKSYPYAGGCVQLGWRQETPGDHQSCVKLAINNVSRILIAKLPWVRHVSVVVCWNEAVTE